MELQISVGDAIQQRQAADTASDILAHERGTVRELIEILMAECDRTGNDQVQEEVGVLTLDIYANDALSALRRAQEALAEHPRALQDEGFIRDCEDAAYAYHRLLQACGGNMQEVSRMLGVSVEDMAQRLTTLLRESLTILQQSFMQAGDLSPARAAFLLRATRLLHAGQLAGIALDRKTWEAPTQGLSIDIWVCGMLEDQALAEDCGCATRETQRRTLLAAWHLSPEIRDALLQSLEHWVSLILQRAAEVLQDIQANPDAVPVVQIEDGMDVLTYALDMARDAKLLPLAGYERIIHECAPEGIAHYVRALFEQFTEAAADDPEMTTSMLSVLLNLDLLAEARRWGNALDHELTDFREILLHQAENMLQRISDHLVEGAMEFYMHTDLERLGWNAILMAERAGADATTVRERWMKLLPEATAAFRSHLPMEGLITDEQDES